MKRDKLWFLHAEISLRIQDAEHLGLKDIADELRKALALTEQKMQQADGRTACVRTSGSSS